MRHMAATVLALPLTLVACGKPTSVPTMVLKSPMELAYTCTDPQGQPLPLGDCSATSARVTLWALDYAQDGVGIFDAEAGAHLDADPFLPGFNPIKVGSDLVGLAAHPKSEAVYVVSRREKTLYAIEAGSMNVTEQALPCTPTDVVAMSVGPLTGQLLIACNATPPGPGLLAVPMDRVGEVGDGDPTVYALSGDPRFLAVSPDGREAFVVHGPLVEGWYMSAVDLSSMQEDRFALGAECSDGFDDDGDGLVDASDPGCSSPGDPSEADDRERDCFDGKDDDGDGATDLDDIDDCGFAKSEVLLPPPECMNGVDDDGDGLTDYPEDPGCYGPTFHSESRTSLLRVTARPIVTPDGRYLYVPVVYSPSILVFETATLKRLRLHPPGGPSEALVLDYLGLDGIVLPAEPVALTATTTSEGSKVFVGLATGSVVSVKVDEAGEPLHALEQPSIPSFPSASFPELWVGGNSIDRLGDPHPEYPSFGPMTVRQIPGEAGKFSYYGVTFDDSAAIIPTERWRVVYEGKLPNAEGKYGYVVTLGDGREAFTDRLANFCSLGVQHGDHLVVEGPWPVCMGQIEKPVEPCSDDRKPVYVNLCEFEIQEVLPQALVLRQIEGFKPLDVFGLLRAPLQWSVRASKSWVVTGSFTGFLHRWGEAASECVERSDLPANFAGRAVTSMPKSGDRVLQCPPREGDLEIDWAQFQNPYLSFSLFPPCRVQADLSGKVCEVERDTELVFDVSGGPWARGVLIGGVPASMVVVGSSLFVADASQGTLFGVSVESLGVQNVWQ